MTEWATDQVERAREGGAARSFFFVKRLGGEQDSGGFFPQAPCMHSPDQLRAAGVSTTERLEPPEPEPCIEASHDQPLDLKPEQEQPLRDTVDQATRSGTAAKAECTRPARVEHACEDAVGSTTGVPRTDAPVRVINPHAELSSVDIEEVVAHELLMKQVVAQRQQQRRFRKQERMEQRRKCGLSVGEGVGDESSNDTASSAFSTAPSRLISAACIGSAPTLREVATEVYCDDASLRRASLEQNMSQICMVGPQLLEHDVLAAWTIFCSTTQKIRMLYRRARSHDGCEDYPSVHVINRRGNWEYLPYRTLKALCAENLLGSVHVLAMLDDSCSLDSMAELHDGQSVLVYDSLVAASHRAMLDWECADGKGVIPLDRTRYSTPCIVHNRRGTLVVMCEFQEERERSQGTPPSLREGERPPEWWSS